MTPHALRRGDEMVPRYTSYPTAPHFHAGVDASTFGAWLANAPKTAPASLYVHVPFCRRLCFYCGCNTNIIAQYEPAANFVDLVRREIDLVAGTLPRRIVASTLQLGGGTPTILSRADFLALIRHMAAAFDFLPGAEIGVEIDPRTLDDERLAALAEAGVSRVSLGVQDFDETVQRAINRLQSFDLVANAVERLRGAGIGGINFDLIYGLPYQNVESLTRTIGLAASLRPDRLAVFGYAHVPWKKRHQQLLERHELPGRDLRLALAATGRERLQAHGYAWIGLDHFALPDDPLARAAAAGALHRNFQGYTTDDAELLLGFGPSAISTLPQGYAQSAADLGGWRAAIAASRFAICRGIALCDDDLLRRAIIERLMCDFGVDIDAMADRFRMNGRAVFAVERAALAQLVYEGIVTLDGGMVTVTTAGRVLVRSVAAVFDRYLARDGARHSAAV